MHEKAKKRLQELPQQELGSWKRAVVTAGGVWHVRGHFSKTDHLL